MLVTEWETEARRKQMEMCVVDLHDDLSKITPFDPNLACYGRQWGHLYSPEGAMYVTGGPDCHFEEEGEKDIFLEGKEGHLKDHVEDLLVNFLLMNADVCRIQYMLTQFMWVAGAGADPEAREAISAILHPKGTPVVPADPVEGAAAGQGAEATVGGQTRGKAPPEQQLPGLPDQQPATTHSPG